MGTSNRGLCICHLRRTEQPMAEGPLYLFAWPITKVKETFVRNVPSRTENTDTTETLRSLRLLALRRWTTNTDSSHFSSLRRVDTKQALRHKLRKMQTYIHLSTHWLAAYYEKVNPFNNVVKNHRRLCVRLWLSVTSIIPLIISYGFKNSRFRRIRKWRKASVSFVMFARNNSAPTGRSFMKFYTWRFFENLSRKLKFH